MKNKNKSTKENIYQTFPPGKNILNLRKVGTVPFLNKCMANHSPDPRRSTISNFQYCSNGNPRPSYFEERYHTETLPLNLGVGSQKKKGQKQKASELVKGCKLERNKSGKQVKIKNRSSSIGKRSLSGFKKKSEEQSMFEARTKLQEEVRKMSCKKVIKRTQFLKITNNYESLLDKMSCLVTKSSETQNSRESWKADEDPEVGKDKLKISLEGLRKLNIPDYDDEFMSHYEELSESWKRDIHKQKRY